VLVNRPIYFGFMRSAHVSGTQQSSLREKFINNEVLSL